jgi:hypothetical protein
MTSIKFLSLYYFILSIILLKESSQAGSGKDIGAYLSVPDSSKLQYRLGNGLGYIGNGWDDAKMSNLSSLAGYDCQRKKLPENHLDNWGYGIEVGDCQSNVKLGILDIVGYLATPLKEHSSNPNGNPELCYPDNLYESIFIEEDGKKKVNPDNYWANYVNKTVTYYKDYVKIWETWNEPDYTRNYNSVNDWKTNPPNPNDLTHWYGSIFQYIRLLRITYEVAKYVDPNCFVATGGIGYSEFLDAILRYTDNPNNGEITDDYPAYGGAYFDCDAYHQYPQYGTNDLETEKGYHENGSDMLALKVVILKKNHEYTLKQHGFDGTQYPKKIFVNTETGVNSESVNGVIGGDLVRRNWILKLALYQIEYDIKQIHMFILADDGKGSADFSNLGKYNSIEEGFTHLKSSSKGRLILKKIQLGKYEYDKENTENFRNSLPEGTTGIVLKRKFRYREVEYYSDYLFSAWIYCEKEEVSGEIQYNLNLKFDPLMIDWEGNQKNILKNDIIKLTSTPIFLIENNYNYPDYPKVRSSSSNLYLRVLVLAINLLLLL